LERVVAASGLAKAICFEAQQTTLDRGDTLDSPALDAPYTPNPDESVDDFIERMVDQLSPQLVHEEDETCNSMLDNARLAVAQKIEQIGIAGERTWGELDVDQSTIPTEDAGYRDAVRDLQVTFASMTASGIVKGGVCLANFIGVPEAGGNVASVGSVIIEGSLEGVVSGASVADVAGSATAGVLSAAMALRNARRTHLARKRAGRFRDRARDTTEGEEELAGALRYSAAKTARLMRERAFMTSCNVVATAAGATAAATGATFVGAPVAAVAAAVALGAVVVGQLGTKVPRMVKWIHKKRKGTHGRGRMKNSQIILAHAVKGSEAAIGCLQDIKAVGKPPAKFPPGRLLSENVATDEWSFAFWEGEAKAHWVPQVEAAKTLVEAEADKAQRNALKRDLKTLKVRRDTDVSAKWDQACDAAKAAGVFTAVRKKMAS
jgi:hypothetical protein